MKNLILAMALCVCTGAAAQNSTVTPLISKNLEGGARDEGAVLMVEFAPGAENPVHRHNAHVFVYVLEGSVVMQVKGSEPVTLGPGQTFYEGPNDVHVVGRNASTSAPAKFLAFFVKDRGAPAVVPAQ